MEALQASIPRRETHVIHAHTCPVCQVTYRHISRQGVCDSPADVHQVCNECFQYGHRDE